MNLETRMQRLRPGLPSPPASWKRLPIDHRGYPVPKFVARVGGQWDFRVVEPSYFAKAMKYRLCWLCGLALNGPGTFVIGPMCVINRVSSEPPCHAKCAEYAARVCPFIVRPAAKRREANMPEHRDMPGISLRRNPGCVAVWTSNSYSPFNVDHGHLYDVGDPLAISWWAEGRAATREEIQASIDSGYPLLLEVAQQDGPASLAALEYQREQAAALLPR